MAWNISDIFRNSPRVNVQQQPNQQQGPVQGQQGNYQQQPQQQPNGQPNSSMQLQNNGGPEQNQNQQPQQQGSPLDAFKDIWQTPEQDPNKPDPFSSPLINLDPNKIQEGASKIDFLANVPQELMQKAMSGQDPQAFLQVINAVAQNTLSYSAQLATATVNQAGTSLTSRIHEDLPNRFRKFQDGLQPVDNPVLDHPAAQPMLQLAMQQIRMKNPEMRPEEVYKQAKTYLQNFASSFMESQQTNPDGTPKQPQKSSQEPDWSSFLN